MTNTQEPGNRKSFSSPQEEINYLRDENHAKTQTITRRRGEITSERDFLKYTYLSPRAENWKFLPQGEMNILTFLHDISNVFIL